MCFRIWEYSIKTLPYRPSFATLITHWWAIQRFQWGYTEICEVLAITCEWLLARKEALGPKIIPDNKFIPSVVTF